MNNRFKLEKSNDLPNWWVITDLENLVVIKFEDKKYNDTQRPTVIEDSKFQDENFANDLAHVLCEMGEYIRRHHGGKAFDCVYGYEYSEDEQHLYLCRYKTPTWRIELPGTEVDKGALASSLKKAAEWLTKSSCDENA